MARLIAYECEDKDHGSCWTAHSWSGGKNEEPTEACGFHADCVPHSLSIMYSYKAQHPVNVRLNAHHENAIKIGVQKMMPKP